MARRRAGHATRQLLPRCRASEALGGRWLSSESAAGAHPSITPRGKWTPRACGSHGPNKTRRQKWPHASVPPGPNEGSGGKCCAQPPQMSRTGRAGDVVSLAPHAVSCWRRRAPRRRVERGKGDPWVSNKRGSRYGRVAGEAPRMLATSPLCNRPYGPVQACDKIGKSWRCMPVRVQLPVNPIKRVSGARPLTALRLGT